MHQEDADTALSGVQTSGSCTAMQRQAGADVSRLAVSTSIEGEGAWYSRLEGASCLGKVD